MMMKMITRNRFNSTDNFFEILSLRSEWELIVSEYKLPDNNGTIDNLKWFVNNGHSSNRFRPKFKHALKIAQTIIDYVDEKYEATNISSMSR